MLKAMVENSAPAVNLATEISIFDTSELTHLSLALRLSNKETITSSSDERTRIELVGRVRYGWRISKLRVGDMNEDLKAPPE